MDDAKNLMKEVRNTCGLSQGQLAKLLGVSEDGVSRRERGLTEVSTDEIIKLYKIVSRKTKRVSEF